MIGSMGDDEPGEPVDVDWEGLVNDVITKLPRLFARFGTLLDASGDGVMGLGTGMNQTQSLIDVLMRTLNESMNPEE